MLLRSSRFGRVVVMLLALAFADESWAEPPRQHSVQVSSTVNVVAQGASGRVAQDEISGSADLFVDIPVGPLSLHVYLEASSTPREGGVFARLPAANTDAGTALGPDNRGRLQLSELRLGWNTGRGTGVHIGLMDLTGFLDVSRIANDENLFFLGAPFVNNPTIDFPDYVLGASIDARAPWSPKVTIAAAVSSSHGLADNPDRSYGELLELGAPNKGAFFASRVRWVGERWRGAVGGWSDSSARSVEDPDGEDHGSRGMFSVLGWASGVHAMNLRLGVAEGSSTGFTSFSGLTYLGQWRQNALGLGIARSGTPSAAAGGSLRQAEAFLRRHLLAVAFVTASLQWLSNYTVVGENRPGGQGVFVAGVRLSASF